MLTILSIPFCCIIIVVLCYMAKKYLIVQATLEGASPKVGFIKGALVGTWLGHIQNAEEADRTPTKNCKKSLICYVGAYVLSAYCVEGILRWMPVPRALTGVLVIGSAIFIVGYVCKFMLNYQLKSKSTYQEGKTS
jgi:hypothetical protein